MTAAENNLHVFYGDLHNHCDVGYGHGSIEDAFDNAALQLDFLCVTPHAFWHDIPTDEPRLASVVDYHRQGFKRTAAQWDHVQHVVRERHRPHEFVTFLGYEWHSRRYGDHCVYFNADEGELVQADDMSELRAALRQIQASGKRTMLIPHHIGYQVGYRGINWAEVDPEFIHLVEIISMHGASECPIGSHRYLHTMGPLDGESTLQYGVSKGHIVGVVGSTDHHSAHPGSYGHGRCGVWAEALTRDAIWEALTARRTFALTGDRIQLAFAINGYQMGSATEMDVDRQIDVQVTGGNALDMIEVLRNNQVIHRWTPPLVEETQWPQTVKVYVEVGWGERGENVDWDVVLHVADGDLLSVEPRFRGHEIVAPQAEEQDRYAFSAWERPNDATVRFTTRTWGNPTTSTASTQGICLELRADTHTRLIGAANGQRVDVAIGDLIAGPHARYLGGFLTPAIYFHRAVPWREYTASFRHTDRVSEPGRDWYYVRVRQRNDQWAWSSPIWALTEDG